MAPKKLPPKGQTAANSRQARGQRTTTAKAQAANQQRVIARGMEGFVRRGQAMDKLDKAAKGTQGSGTRTAGAGGGLANRPSSAVQSRQSSASAPKGGAVVTQGRNPLGGQRSLPPGRRGGSVEKAGPTIDVKAKPPRSAPPIRNPNGTTGNQARQRADALPNRGRTSGGRMQNSRAGSTQSNRLEQVQIRDLGSTPRNRMGNGTQRAIPPGRTGGALTRTGANSGTSAALRGAAKAGRGLLGKALTPLAIAQEVQDMVSRDRRWNEYKERNYGNTKVKPKQGNAESRFSGARDRNLQRINSDPRFAAPKETPKPPAPRQQPPAASAPAARPSASRPSQTSPSRTTATGSGTQQARPAEKKPSMGREAFDRAGKGSLGPNYGIDQYGDKNGIDMERRRAFLDAKDSQEGRKAISKLMEERRKKQRENDSISK